MAISYIHIKKSFADPDYTVRDASIISSLVYKPELNKVDLQPLEVFSIYLEQAILSDYLLKSDPLSKDLSNFNKQVHKSFDIKKKQFIKNNKDKENIYKESNLLPSQFEAILNYMSQPNKTNNFELVSACESLEKQFFDKCSFLSNFYTPYLYQNEYPHTTNDTYPTFNNPVLLTPKFTRFKTKDNANNSPIILTPTSFFSNTYRPNPLNKFYSFIANMNYNNLSWQNVVDVLQKFSLSNSVESLCNIPNLLHHYLRGHYIPGAIDKKEAKAKFLYLLFYINKYNKLSISNGNPQELSRLMSTVFADDRFYYLLNEDPTISEKENFLSNNDIAWTISYAMEAATSESGTEQPQDEEADDQGDEGTDEGTEEDTGEEDTGDEGGEEGGDDDFSFGDDESGDEGDDTGGAEGSDEEADPEDVNPLIQIIENESFDEYLERGEIEKKLLAIFKNPPTKLSANQLNTMKFWYAQWFPLVSIETTKMILGDLLDLTPNEENLD